MSFISNANSIESHPTPVKIDPKVLDCQPKILRPGDTLTLKLGPGHGSELAIKRESDETSFILVVDDPTPQLKLIMTREEFKKTNLVKIRTDITAFAHSMSHSGIEKVFSSSGYYEIFISDILESELGGHVCTVKFQQ